MTIEERVELYKSLYKECKALEPVANTLAKGYKQADPRKRLELIRELDTELAEVYMVRIPVITCGVRDDNYVHSTKEIYLADPELEAFLHQFRHHLQNEARELSRKYLLMEDDPYALIYYYYEKMNNECYYSYSQLEQITGTYKNKIIRSLAKLEEGGYIRILTKENGKKYYRIIEDKLVGIQAGSNTDQVF